MTEPTKLKILNLSQIEFEYEIDRATIRRRLRSAGIQPTIDKAREKGYEITPEVEAIIRGIEDEELEAAKLRKLIAEADEREIKVAERKGELLPIYDVKDELSRIFSKLHREFAVQMPKRVATKLKKAKDAAEVQKIMSAETGKIFDQLRVDYAKFLG